MRQQTEGDTERVKEREREREREGERKQRRRGNPEKLARLIPSSIKTTRSRIKRRDYRRRAGKISAWSIKRRSLPPPRWVESPLFSNLHFIVPRTVELWLQVGTERQRQRKREKERERERQKGKKGRKNAAITSLAVNSLYYSVVFVWHHGADRAGQITKIATPERVIRARNPPPKCHRTRAFVL